MFYSILTTSLIRECSKLQPDLKKIKNIVNSSNINKRDFCGYTPLMKSVNLEVINFLLKNSADPNMYYKNNPTLVVILNNLKKKQINFDYEQLVKKFTNYKVNLLTLVANSNPLFIYILHHNIDQSNPSSSYINLNVCRLMLNIMDKNNSDTGLF